MTLRHLLLGRPATTRTLRELAARHGVDAAAFSEQLKLEASFGLVRFDSPTGTWRAA